MAEQEDVKPTVGQALAALRWAGKSTRARKAHSRMMHAAKIKKAATRKARKVAR